MTASLPAVLHLLQCEEVVRLTRQRLNGRGAAIDTEAGSAAIEVAIASLVAARAEMLTGNVTVSAEARP